MAFMHGCRTQAPRSHLPPTQHFSWHTHQTHQPCMTTILPTWYTTIVNYRLQNNYSRYSKSFCLFQTMVWYDILSYILFLKSWVVTFELSSLLWWLGCLSRFVRSFWSKRFDSVDPSAFPHLSTPSACFLKYRSKDMMRSTRHGSSKDYRFNLMRPFKSSILF